MSEAVAPLEQKEAVDQRDAPEYTHGIVMVLFLLGWGVSFLTLFIAYLFIRVKAPVWPPEGSPELPTTLPIVCSFLVAGSSLAFHRALVVLRRDERSQVKNWLLGACALGLVFLVLQWVGWAELWGSGLKVGQNAYAGTFYMLTIFHALHVVAGILVVGFYMPKLLRGEINAKNHNQLKLTGWFWHFVTGAWAVTYVLLYLF